MACDGMWRASSRGREVGGTTLGLPPGSSAEHVWEALAGSVLAWGEIVAPFTKP
ncbi:MAG: hypothetical protein WDA16_02845 [Candidatus Thermoplasmatota archaeon]